MKRTITFILFILFKTSISAQVFYPQDTIAYRYKHETIHLQSNGFVKDGNIMPYGSQRSNLRAELEKNGNFEAIDQFKRSRKFNRVYLGFSVLGTILTILLIGPVFAAPSVGGVILFLLTIAAVTLVSSIFQRKSFDFLNRAVWFYNQHVLFRK